MKPPVIVVPGITATSLRDHYPAQPENVWGIIRRDYERVGLHPDDLRYEQMEPALLRPDEVFSIPYEEYVKELRHDLSRRRDEPRPVYLFPHDWRHPIGLLAEQLRDFVDEVIARTALLRHYAKSGYTTEDGQVDLVGHSMGGLIVAGYLSAHPQDHRARKVVTLGTPYGGSFEAVLKIITGTSDLGGGVPKSQEREVARVTPALYHLLPDDTDGDGERVVRVEPGLPKNLFEAGLWQEGVLETIAEHIRLHGVDPPRSKAERIALAKKLLQGMLDEAKAFRKRVQDFDLDDVGLHENDWMAIVGVGEETRLALRIEKRRDAPFFILSSLQRKNGYPKPGDGARLEDTGDGTVPYWAARPPFLDVDKLIAVSDDDFGYWEELGNRLIERWASNLHGMLPAMNRVLKLTVAFLESESGRKGSAHDGLKGRRAPDLDPDADWDPPIAGLEDREERPGD